jgi:signal recognition particle subunit SEC65
MNQQNSTEANKLGLVPKETSGSKHPQKQFKKNKIVVLSLTSKLDKLVVAKMARVHNHWH